MPAYQHIRNGIFPGYEEGIGKEHCRAAVGSKMKHTNEAGLNCDQGSTGFGDARHTSFRGETLFGRKTCRTGLEVMALLRFVTRMLALSLHGKAAAEAVYRDVQ